MIWPWALPRDRMTWPGAPPAPGDTQRPERALTGFATAVDRLILPPG